MWVTKNTKEKPRYKENWKIVLGLNTENLNSDEHSAEIRSQESKDYVFWQVAQCALLIIIFNKEFLATRV